MRKLIFCLCCLLWAIPACAGDLELDLECLQEAYPGFITGTETDDAGHVWFLTKNGGRLLYDDGKMKSHAELLENADIEDAMRQPYPLEPERPDFAPDEEPGRIRCTAFEPIVPQARRIIAGQAEALWPEKRLLWDESAPGA